MQLSEFVSRLIPEGWSWCLYGPCSNYAARAVLISPDYRIQIGREGKSIDDAIRAAARDARSGARA